MEETEPKPLSSYERCKTQVHELNQLKSRLEQLKTELGTLQTKYDQCLHDYEVKLQQFHSQVEATCQEQDEKEANLANAAVEWLEIKAKLESSVMPPKHKVTLNVGGTYFETTIGTLTRYDTQMGGYFKTLFSRQWQLEKDSEDDSIFIDRNGYLFGFILQYLRTGSVAIDPKCDLLRRDLVVEADFYGLDGLVDLLQTGHPKNEADAALSQQLHAKSWYPSSKILAIAHQERLNGLFGCDSQRWQLIYSASRDGYTAKAFHEACDDRCPTITIIRSKNGCLFGGFTSVAWSSKKQTKEDSFAFLFTLKNPHGIEPMKYPVREERVRFAVTHTATDGPTFGSAEKGGVDLLLASPFNVARSRTFFSKAYYDTTKKDRFTFTGDPYFVCDDVEVFCPA